MRRDGIRIPFEEARADDLEDLQSQMREEWQATVRAYRMGFAYGPA